MPGSRCEIRRSSGFATPLSDITYIPTGEGWLYLAGIKDLCSKEIVGFNLSPRMDTALVADALHKAFHVHRPLPGLILHSDRGSQYCSHAYQENIEKYQMVGSMSRKGTVTTMPLWKASGVF